MEGLLTLQSEANGARSGYVSSVCSRLPSWLMAAGEIQDRYYHAALLEDKTEGGISASVNRNNILFSVDERRRLQRLLPFSRHEEPFPLPPLEWSVDWSMDWSWWTYTSSFHIGGGRDDGDGGLLLHLAGVLLLDYYAAEGIGAALPRRLYFEVTRLEVHEKFGSVISSLAVSTTTETGGCYPSWLGRFC